MNEYLGDGVYAKSDGEQISLTVGSHTNPTLLYLDKHVMEALVRFAQATSVLDEKGEE